MSTKDLQEAVTYYHLICGKGYGLIIALMLLVLSALVMGGEGAAGVHQSTLNAFAPIEIQAE